eukprot:TRINITY_DN10249_c0_g1_i1.p1 TRINITY_DN10249_c0_g1~~TRINITY_DN10249_c0_g1_i1.p1  ORF type:complete len:419 (-),score=83.33 TRINITY_DN10249_c0_g1_i1:37-1293(-)
MKQVKAVTDYHQKNYKELSLTKGSVYKVIQLSNNGAWILGHPIDSPIDEVGWFPATFVEENFEDEIRYYGKAKKYSKGGSMYWEVKDEEITVPSKFSFREKGSGNGEVRIHVIRAEFLYFKKVTVFIVRRSFGTEDYHCVCKTKRVKGGSGFPCWNEEFQIQSYNPEMEVIDIVISTEKNWKRAKGKVKRTCKIPLRSSIREFDYPGSQLRWFDLEDSNEFHLGRILLNIQYKSHSISSPISISTTEDRLQFGKIPRNWEKLSPITMFPCNSESILNIQEDFSDVPVDILVSGQITISTVQNSDCRQIIHSVKDTPLMDVVQCSVVSVKKLNKRDDVQDMLLSGKIKVTLKEKVVGDVVARENQLRQYLMSSMENCLHRVESEEEMNVCKEGLLNEIESEIRQRRLFQILNCLEARDE